MFQIKTFNAIAPEGMARLIKKITVLTKVKSRTALFCAAKSSMIMIFQNQS